MLSLLRSRELVRYNLATAHINLLIVRQGNKPISGVPRKIYYCNMYIAWNVYTHIIK